MLGHLEYYFPLILLSMRSVKYEILILCLYLCYVPVSCANNFKVHDVLCMISILIDLVKNM
jgi:hypothetical protein